jgi:hypothetical protein
MANHAGYGGVLTISASFAQKILHAYYTSENMSANLSSGEPLILGAKKDKNNQPLPDRYLHYDLFLAEPLLDFSSRTDNKIGLFIRLGGTLRFNNPDNALPEITCTVQIDFNIPTNVVTREDATGIAFNLNFEQCFIESFQSYLISGTDPINHYLFNLQTDLQNLIQGAFLIMDTSGWKFTPPGFDELQSLGVEISPFPDVVLFGEAATIAVNADGITSGNKSQLKDLLNTSLEKGWIKTYSDHIHKFDDEFGEPIFEEGWTATTKRQAGLHDECGIAFCVHQDIIQELYNGIWRQDILDGFEEEKAEAIQKALDKAEEENKEYDEPEIAKTDIQSINISLENDHLFISGEAEYTGIDITFSFSIKVVKTTIDGSTVFVGNHQNLNGIRGEVYNVDVNMPGWLVFLQAFIGSLGIAMAPFTFMFSAVIALIFEVTIGAIVLGATEKAKNKMHKSIMNQLASFNSKFTFTLPNTEFPEITIQPNDIVVGTDGLTTWLMTTVSYESFASLTIPATNNAPNWSVHNRKPIQVKFSAPEGFYHPDDTQVRIRWQVFAETKSNLIINRDEAINKSWTFSLPKVCFIDHAKEEWEAFEKYIITCMVYRPWGQTTQEYFFKEISVIINDRLNREKPYVQWKHSVYYKGYSGKKNDPNRKSIGWIEEKRTSQIHKTDPDERCLFVDNYPLGFDKDDLIYLDTLPFNEADIKLHLKEICEYCFFGGPDKLHPPKPKKPFITNNPRIPKNFTSKKRK